MTFTPARDEAPTRGKGSGTRTKRAAAPRPSRASLRKEIDGFVVFLNGVVAVIAPNDALDTIEVPALVQAIDEEAKANPRFRRGLEALLNVTGGGSLLMVVSIIGARRVARHTPMGRMGPIVDDGGAFILSTINAEPSEAAETMASIVGMFTKPADAETDATSTAATNGGPA